MSTAEKNPPIDGSADKPKADRPKKPKKKRPKYRSPQVRIAIAATRLVVIGYATILLALVFMETRLVYPGAFFSDDRGPTSGIPNPNIETVQYMSTDGVALKGRLIERESSDEVVLFFHGNGVKAKWMDSWLTLMSDEFNASAMICEYRGYDDEKTPDEKGVLADCFAARDYVCDRFQKKPNELILYGRSLGGGCAVAVASQGGAKALVLERTFDRLVNVAAGQYPYIPVRLLMRNRYDSIARLTVYDAPLVVLHGTADTLIPIAHGERLYASADCPEKHWIAVNGLGHNDSLPLPSLREIVTKVREFTAEP